MNEAIGKSPVGSPIGSNAAGPGQPDLSVVIPVYNEEESLRPLFEALRPVLAGLGRTWEVLLVDDGSNDGSAEVLLSLKRAEPSLRVIRFERNQGQSCAFWFGFQHARGDVIVTLDADLQNDPADIPLILSALEGADAAIGWRHERRDPFLKLAASRIANGFRNWLTRENVHDTGCSLKAFRRHVLIGLFPFKGMHRFLPTLVKMNGYRVAEVKVRHRPRERGKSKYGIWNRLLGPLADCLAVRWMQRRYVGRPRLSEIAGEQPPAASFTPQVPAPSAPPAGPVPPGQEAGAGSGPETLGTRASSVGA